MTVNQTPIATVNPATGEVLKEFEPYRLDEIERRVSLADRTFRTWRRTSFAERADIVNALASVLEREEQTLGRLITTEMGKPVVQARAEVQKCATALRWVAEHAEAALADELVVGTAAKKRSYVTYQPLGAVLAVMPWNYPLWQVVRFLAPTLMGGNVGLLKHASNVPQTALALEDACRQAGAPDGVFQTLLIGSDAVPALLSDPRVKAVTFTGSEAAGRAVAAQAGREIKKSVLELGGSDPFIIMPSGDLDCAVETGVKARMQNNGQSCIAAKRFIVHESIADEIEARFAEESAALVVGDPLDTATDIGPLASAQGRAELATQVGDALAYGATLLTGAVPLDGPGFYYRPTVLTGITDEMRIDSEETFGPVAAFYRVGDVDEAIALANRTSFGLGASAFTNDPAEQQRFVEEIESGMVFINWMTTSYPELPFGGVKRSGYGRELSTHGLREFVDVKTVWID